MRGPKGESGFNSLYGRYKRGASDRKLKWALSRKVFRRMTSKPCHYCGVEPKQSSCTSQSRLTPTSLAHAEYIFNGIDRKNPKLGYVPANCVPCCFLCNRAKNSQTYRAFVEWLSRASKFSKRKG